MPALRPASPATFFLPARYPMMALAIMPAVTRTPHSGRLIHGLLVITSGANVWRTYCDRYPSAAIPPQRSAIVAAPATYIELRALSIVA